MCGWKIHTNTKKKDNLLRFLHYLSGIGCTFWFPKNNRRLKDLLLLLLPTTSSSLVRSFIHRLFCAVLLLLLLLFFSWDSNLSVSFVDVVFDSIPSYKVEAGWVLEFVVWLSVVVVIAVWLLRMMILWLLVDDLSSILCRSGSSLAFPNMKLVVVVEVGWLFVAASGQCHCLVLGRQGQIVVHGAAMAY